MKVKWWHVPPALCLAVIIVGVLSAGPAALAAEAEADDYDAEYCREVGDAHYKRGEYEEALKWYERAERLMPLREYIHYNKAITFYELGRYEEAVSSYDGALKQNPDHALAYEAYEGKGAALTRLGEFEQALEAFDEALARNPEYARAHLDKGIALHKLGRYEEAAQSFGRAANGRTTAASPVGFYATAKAAGR